MVVVVMPKGMVKVQSPLTVRCRPCSSVTRRKPCPAAATSCPGSDNRCPGATRVQVVSGNVAIIGKAGAPVSYSERVGSNMVSDGARRAGNTPSPRSPQPAAWNPILNPTLRQASPPSSLPPARAARVWHTRCRAALDSRVVNRPRTHAPRTAPESWRSACRPPLHPNFDFQVKLL